MIGTDWRHPLGPQSGLEGKWEHPVVHVCYEDADAYADFAAAMKLPRDSDAERAARTTALSQAARRAAE